MTRIAAISAGIFAAIDWYAFDGKLTNAALTVALSEWHHVLAIAAPLCGRFC
jgi:hypothetical protein